MRNTLLTSTALAFVLSMGGAAIAADDTTKSGQSDSPAMERSTDTSGSGTAGSGSVGATTQSDADSYRSLNSAGDFSGSIAGGFKADELIGTDVVGPDGETVGEIADVLIDSEGNANHVLVDVGGFLGIGAKRIALSIDELSRQGEQLATTMTEEELEQQASYEQESDSWMRHDSDQPSDSGATPGATTPSTGTTGGNR